MANELAGFLLVVNGVDKSFHASLDEAKAKALTYPATANPRIQDANSHTIPGVAGASSIRTWTCDPAGFWVERG